MAASMCFRVRLNIHDLNTITRLNTWKYWYNVDTNKVVTIEDLANDVIESFCSDSLSAPLHVQLHLDGFVLPGWESTQVLRENDEIKFTVTSFQNSTSSKPSSSGTPSNKRKIKTPKERATKKVKESESPVNGEKKKDHGAANQRKKKSDPKLTSAVEAGTSSSSSESESSEEEDTEKSNQLKTKSSAKPPTRTNTESATIEKQANNKKAQKKNAQNSIKNAENSSSESKSDSETSDESNKQEQSKPLKLKSQSQSAVSKKNVKNTPVKSTENNKKSDSSSTSESDDEFKKNAKSIMNTISTEIPVKPVCDNSHVQKQHSKTDKNALPIHDKAEVQTAPLTVGAVVQGMKKKRTRRGKTRCRPKKKNNLLQDDDQLVSGSVDYDVWHKTHGKNQYEIVQDVSVLDENIVSITPVSHPGPNPGSKKKTFGSDNFKASTAWKKRGYNYNGGGKHMKFNSDHEDEDIVETNAMEWEDPVATGNQDSLASLPTNHPKGNFINLESTENGNRPQNYNYAHGDQRNVQTTGTGNNSTALTLEVQGGVQVFTRAKRLNKKKASFPLSEAQELSNQVQHKSFTFEETDSGEQVMKSKAEKELVEDSRHSQTQMLEDPEPKIAPKDYSQYELLHGIPRIGDKIAYKILEVSESYSPEVSDYKEALVTGYDPITQMVELEVTFAKGKSKQGRFDCFVESEEEVLTNYQSEMGKRVQLSWTSLIEPRLLKDESK